MNANQIDITGYDKAEVLAALYNASVPLGLGNLHFKNEVMTVEQARDLLKEQTYFDYLYGRVMKIDLSTNHVRFDLYNRDLGDGAFQTVLSSLKKHREPIFKITVGDDSAAYAALYKQIVALYNQYSDFKENLTLNNPSATAVIHVSGIDGGVLIDKFAEVDFLYRVMFAAFPPEHQRKGLLRGCLAKAKDEGLDIGAVELNLFDAPEVWEKVGFTESCTLGLTIGRCTPEFARDYVRDNEEGIDVEMLLDLLRRSKT